MNKSSMCYVVKISRKSNPMDDLLHVKFVPNVDN